jgi:hypothetical protein
MTMPKTAVNEDNLPLSSEYDIGTSWQVFRMLRIPNAHGSKHLPYGHFWRGILASDEAHSFASFGWAERVRHGAHPLI